MQPIVLLGCGNMGAALARGIARQGLPAGALRLVEPDRAKVEELARDTGGVPFASVGEALPGARVLILAIKPQVFPEAAKGLSGRIPADCLVLSLMAGVPRAKIAAALGEGVRVARCMPNLPMTVSSAATALARDGLDATEFESLRALLASCGEVAAVSESQLDAVTGLSGSGPAFVLKFLMALEDGGVLCGLPRPEARRLARATVRGTLDLLERTGEEADVLRGQVTSPGGTTIAGLMALEEGRFAAVVMDAVRQASERSRELGR